MSADDSVTPSVPPTYQSWATLSPGQSISFGGAADLAPLVLDGSAPFTVLITALLPDVGGDAVLFAKGAQFSLGLIGGQPAATLGGQTVALTGMAPTAGQWFTLTATYTPTGAGSGSMTVYIDGFTAAPTTLTGVHAPEDGSQVLVGGSLTAQVLGVCLWSVAVGETTCAATQWTMPDGCTSGLVGCYCFSRGSANDCSGHARPIHLLGGAAQAASVPVLALSGGYATPGALDGASLGAASGDPWTVAAWIAVDSGATGAPTIYSDGGQVGAGVWVRVQRVIGSATDFSLLASSGGLGGVAVAASSTFAGDAWRHVAATYDGDTLQLYVDGVKAGSASGRGQTLLATLPPAIGAQLMTDGSTQNGFLGQLGPVMLWTRKLSHEDIVAAMTADTGAPSDALASYAMLDPSNNVSGQPLTLVGGAALTTASAPVVAAPPDLAVPTPDPHLRAVNPKLLAAAPRGAAKFDEARELAAYAQILAGIDLPAERRDALRTRFADNLRRGVAISARAPGQRRVTSRREGTDHVFYYGAEAGPVEVGRIPAARLRAALPGDSDDCAAWYITIAADAIVLIVTAIGLAPAVGPVTKFLTKWLSGSLEAVLPALRTALSEAGSATHKVLEVLEALHDAGALYSALGSAITGLHWWNWAFIVGGVVLRIVAMWASGGWYLAVVLADMALSIADFSAALAERPAGC